jgi:hypothetical protein
MLAEQFAPEKGTPSKVEAFQQSAAAVTQGAGNGRFVSEIRMRRHAGNFNPEWGYLAPAPSFMRSARMVVVAAAVGATAGAAVVFSLVDRPAAEESVAARTLAPPAVTAAAAVRMPEAAQLQAHPQLPPRAAPLSATKGVAARLAVSESGTEATTQSPVSAGTLAEAAAADAHHAQGADAGATAQPENAAAPKKPVKKAHSARTTPRNDPASRQPLALLRSFVARTLNGEYGLGGEN